LCLFYISIDSSYRAFERKEVVSNFKKLSWAGTIKIQSSKVKKLSMVVENNPERPRF
jgi:hypothetical protein